ncbi:hypothetical protein HGA34_03805 [Candidatus Falkowbacteria bacterium]|nr:hypothetical protein [Candidatus Falkowbacteria bacterium]
MPTEIDKTKLDWRNQGGQLLLEMLLLIGVIVMVGGLVSQITYASLRANKSASFSSITEGLIDEEFAGVTAATYAKWHDLYNLTKSTSSHYHISQSAGAWQIGSGDEVLTIDGVEFTRHFDVSNVCRDDATKAIVATDGVPPCTAGNSDDPSTQKVTAYVSWNGGSASKSEYLTRWRNLLCQQSSWSATSSATSTCSGTSYGSGANIEASSSIILQAN